MSTPAQPAPVTPPPEPWMVKAKDEIVNRCLLAGFGIAPMHVEEIIARHAPPPAPSCPTEQGERWNMVTRSPADWLELLQRCQNGDASCMFVLGAINEEIAISRQPAPSADASSQTGEENQMVKDWKAEMKEARDFYEAQTVKRIARIASLETELAAALEQAASDKCYWDKQNQHLMDDLAQLRAAPSAVAGGGEDGARLDWLARHWDSQQPDPELFVVVPHNPTGSFRDAIDAAIAATKAKEGKE